MTTYYVGSGGNNSNNGLSWANRKLTLNGAEDIPVVAGDTVYVGAGLYREMLTCDVSGSSGAPITYIGDYTGANTDGIGGVVRWTTTNDDIVSTRNICVKMEGRNYRTFEGFSYDGPTSIYSCFWVQSNSVDHLTIRNSLFEHTNAIRSYQTALITNMLLENCVALDVSGLYTEGAVQDNCGNLIQNCLIIGAGSAIDVKSGGTLVKNCMSIGTNKFVVVSSTLNSGQVVTVNNCIILFNINYALSANTLGNLVEDYNVCPSRNNVAVGNNSTSQMPLLDKRWFHELINGGSMITPFDLASFSLLINRAGTSPTTADMRGTTVQGTQREWGALEYDSTLDIEAGAGGGLLTHPGMTAGMRG